MEWSVRLRTALDEVVTTNKWGRSASTVNYDLIVFGSEREELIDILAPGCLASWWAVTAMSSCFISATSG